MDCGGVAQFAPFILATEPPPWYLNTKILAAGRIKRGTTVGQTAPNEHGERLGDGHSAARGRAVVPGGAAGVLDAAPGARIAYNVGLADGRGIDAGPGVSPAYAVGRIGA